MDVVPRTRRLVLVSQHATQLDSLSAPGGAVQFDLRSDTESVLSGPEVPQDAFGQDVESVDDEVWSVAGTLQGFAGRLPRTTDVWKLWLTVFLFAEGPSSQLTRPSCVRYCDVLHTLEPPSMMEQFSRQCAGGRNDASQNWWDLEAELDWWCSRWKLGAGGRLRPGLSLPTWPRHGLVKRRLFCRDAQNRRGA